MNIVILDRQHAGKRASPNDAGAAFDLDGDGVRGEQGEREIDLTLLYGEYLAMQLVALGVEVVRYGWPGFVGDYRERHAAAIKLAKSRPTDRVLYCAIHVNAGGGAYALAEYDERSKAGKAAAVAVAAALDALPEITAGKVNGLNATERGFACVGGIYAGPSNLSAVLLEPFFIDAPGHRALCGADGLRRVAGALCAGIVGALA